MHFGAFDIKFRLLIFQNPWLFILMERKKILTYTRSRFFPLNCLLVGGARAGMTGETRCWWKFTLNKTCHIGLNWGFAAYNSNSHCRHVATYRFAPSFPSLPFKNHFITSVPPLSALKDLLFGLKFLLVRLSVFFAF